MSSILDLLGRDGPFVVRLLVAMLLGGLVGIERQTRGRAAGLRTNILVCLGSAAIVVAFQKLSSGLGPEAEAVVRMDPARAAAGVITGIGFLGAGTIVKSKDFVRGLTTAASIWVVSAVGVTVGLGEFVIASTLTALVLFSLYALHRVPISADFYYSLRMTWHGDPDLIDEIVETLGQAKTQIKSQRIVREPKTGRCEVTLSLRLRNRSRVSSVVNPWLSDTRFDEVVWG